ncbi:MAG: hypothetical protein P0Y60_00980 [Candidatus Microbacterium colombiense]|nr:MAG: hypothetical protein P0Y60_00980 [Microbacterium sp.]
MDDKTPTPDQTSTPDQIPTSGQTPAPESAPAPAAKPGRRHALLIGGGIAAAVVLAGGGIAVGAAIGDEFGGDDDRSSQSEGIRHDDDQDRGGQRGEDRGDDAPAESSSTGGATADVGTASADELVAIADAARGAADGDVTSIDAQRDGTWEVQLTTSTGDETEVIVDDVLATAVRSTDPADGDDTGPALTLDDDAIRALVAAALAEAEGLITDLDVDDDTVSPYDVSVLTTDNRSIDIDLDAAFAVVGTGIDD